MEDEVKSSDSDSFSSYNGNVFLWHWLGERPEAVGLREQGIYGSGCCRICMNLFEYVEKRTVDLD